MDLHFPVCAFTKKVSLFVVRESIRVKPVSIELRIAH